MKTIDYLSKEFICQWQKENFAWISDVTIEDEERETGGWDLTLTTTAGTKYSEEIKTISSAKFLNEYGEFSDYFSVTGNGICRNMRYCNVPNSGDSLEEIFVEYYNSYCTNTIEDYDMDETPIPTNLKDKKIWIVNASAIARNGSEIVMSNQCKWWKLVEEKGILILMAEDGVIVFTPKMLREAFCGYARMKCKHINNANAAYKDNQHYSYELKALIDLSKGKLFKINVQKKILNTH